MNVLLTTSAAPDQTPFSTNEKRPPIGLGFLISVLRDAGHNVFFIDNYLCPSDFLDSDYLQRHQIDFVGIYTNTICFRDSLRMFYRLEDLRQEGAWKGKIIAGGPHASVSPETIPHFVDHIVIGEGEIAILDIVAGKVKEQIVQYPSIENLDKLPMPAWDYFAEMSYDWGGNWLPESPVFTMNTSRGCPFDCTFCSVGSIWGRRYTYFSAERVVADIEYLVKHHGAKGIYFREDNFTLNKKRLHDFCNLMISKDVNIPWVCETRASSLDRETVELMASAGAKGAYIGVESGSQRLLDFMQKGIKIEDVHSAFRLCQEFGINTAASVIVGVPTETEQEVQMTIELLDEIKPTVTWYNVFVGIPKSKLYMHVLENKLFEYIDDRGLVYLKGHNERVLRWYGHAWAAELPVQLQNNTIINPKVSVVMSVYNGEKYLREAIRSVLSQTLNNYEFVIINDASTDKSAEILQEIEDPRIRVLTNEQNRGLTKSLNKAVKHCRGEFIGRMDADDLSHPMRLEKQVSFLESHPSCALVGSSYYVIDEEGKTISHVGVLLESQQIKEELKNQNWFGHGSVLMRKSAFSKVGGYDEEFRYAQDYDLWLRLSEQYDVANIKEPLYFWRCTVQAISRDKAREQQVFAELAKKYALIRAQQSGAKLEQQNMQVSPMASIIVPTHNRPDMLKETIQSILDQTFQDFEVIVVNDAGQDVSSVVEAFNSPKLSYLSHETNKGLAGARNTGLRAARGTYIAYLDDDDIFYPDHLDTLVTFLQESGEKVAYTDAFRAHQAMQGDGTYVVTERDVPYSFDFNFKDILIGNFIPVTCIMHDIKCIHEAGYFDESLHSHEDWDLWIRMSQKYAFHHIKKLTCEFRWREDGTSMTSSKEPEFISTQERIYEKYQHISSRMPDVAQAQQRELYNRKKRAGVAIPIACSIIIPVFNQVAYTERCLEMLYANTPESLSFEVIVVDNASTDDTAKFLNEATRRYHNLRVIHNDENLLFAKACNQGAQAAQGEYLVFLNNDTEALPGWFEKGLTRLKSDPAIGAVGSKLLYPDGTIQHCGIEFIACPGLEPPWPKHRFLCAAADDPRVNISEEVDMVTGACLFISKELFRDIGGFCPDYGMYFEDIDLCMKIRKRGMIIWYEPLSVLVHHESKSSQLSRENLDSLCLSASTIFYKRWLPEIKSGAYQNHLMSRTRSVGTVRKPSIVIDGVIFQLQHGRPFGISRLWWSLLTELAATPLAGRIVLLDRDGTAPEIPGIRLRRVTPFQLGTAQEESPGLDRVCCEENAGIFISTYYTYTNATPSLLMLYDMIPERFDIVGPDAPNPEWRDKYHAIVNSLAFAAISRSTARDLTTFYPRAAESPLTVVSCAVSDDFMAHSEEEIAAFKAVNGIDRPYFLLVGRRDPHKNAALFFQAFAQLPDRGRYAIVMAGGGNALEQELRELAGPAAGYAGFFSDQDLSLAYSGALALVYPSLYEGFGLPILEAMQSGCPVITCQNSSLPEVAGSAALYVGEQDIEGMAKALMSVQQPDVRAYLVKRGLERARQFSWQESANLLAKTIEECVRANV